MSESKTTTYNFRHEPQSAPRIGHVEVPPAFAAALREQWAIVQRDQVNPVIDFAEAKEATLHLSYAREWGRTHEPQLTVRKGTVRADDKPGTLRLLISKFDATAPKRGRKPNADKETAKSE